MWREAVGICVPPWSPGFRTPESAKDCAVGDKVVWRAWGDSIEVFRVLGHFAGALCCFCTHNSVEHLEAQVFVYVHPETFNQQ